MNDFARLLFIFLLVSARTAFALAPERHITELGHRVWDSKSGVPSEIRALAQTTDGYLWVGSLRGLYRFDGIQFQSFEPKSGAQLPSHEIRSLFATADDRLWIGYLKGGVSVLKGGELVNYNSVDGFPEGNVRGFALDHQGTIWAASTGGLASFDGRRWHTVSSESSFPGSRASAVLVDHQGALWVASEHHIAVLPPHASKFELTDEPYNGQVYQLVGAPDGTVWMAETTRAVRPLMRPGQGSPYKGLTKADCQSMFPSWQTEPKCRRPDDLEVRVGSQALLFDQTGSLWITTLGDGLRRAPYPLQLPKQPIGEFSSALEQFTSKDGLSADVTYAILEDHEGNIWVASRDGIDQFRNSVLAPVALGSAASQVSIVPGDDGYAVAMDHDGAMYRFRDAHDKINLKSKEEEPYGLYRDPFGSIWGTGLVDGCRFVGGECATRLEVPGGKKGPSDQPWRLAVDHNHRLLAYVAERGLFAFEDGRWSRFGSASPAPASAVPTTQYTDAAGRVWFGFQDGRALTIIDGLVHLYSSEDGLAVGEIKAICSAGTNVWVGGTGGLALLRGPRFTPVRPYDARAFGSVSGVVEAEDGSLWLNEYRGVIRIPASEVATTLQDGAHLTHYDLFTSTDGLPGATEQFVISSTAIRGTDGRLWFATTNGAAWVDPRHLYRNEVVPPVVIQSVVADGRTLSPSGKLELPGNTINLQIAYAGLSFSIPERVQFRYRLKGLDRDWQSAGTKRTAYYTKLAPGSYDFQVIASNDAGVWNSVGAELAIRIIPAWHQSRWFYVLCAALLISALALLYRVRVAQVRAQTHSRLQARLLERERIARELHDTLIQGFQGLILSFEAAMRRLPRGQAPREQMEETLGRADQVLAQGRERVRGLRESVVYQGDLRAALADFATDLAALYPATCVVGVQGAERQLHPVALEEIYSIAREALANAFRHSGAQRVEAEVVFGTDRLRIRIGDNGKGIDADVLAKGSVPGHWGLPGMRERAKKLGAKLRVRSGPGTGTEVELEIPAAVAYRGLHDDDSWWRRLRRRLRNDDADDVE